MMIYKNGEISIYPKVNMVHLIGFRSFVGLFINFDVYVDCKLKIRIVGFSIYVVSIGFIWRFTVARGSNSSRDRISDDELATNGY